MHEKSTLRKDVHSMMGKTLTDNEAKSFNIFNLLGKECMVNIIHKQSGDKTFANIQTITPVPKGMVCPPAVNPQLVFSTQQPDMDAFRKLPEFVQDKIKLSDEFIAYMESQMNDAKYSVSNLPPTFEVEKPVNPSDFEWMQGESEDPTKLPF
jgi:hypothetical protein